MADRYSHGHHASVLASHADRTAASSCGYLLPHLRPGLHVLDVGCGPGTITADLARLVGPGGRVVGIEPVPAPLSAAREAARARGAAVELALADVYALPFEDDAFDVVHAHQVLQHLTDPVGALREMARVCRPGGLVAARDADYAGMHWWPQEPVLDRWLASYRANARANGAEPDAGRRLRSWALAADLDDLTVTASTWCYATPESTRWWGGSWAQRAVSSEFARQTVERGLESPDSLREISEAWRRWGEGPDACFVVPHVEVLARPRS